jgi:hypothetical protein
MKNFANHKRVDREFAPGDMFYLRLQHYRLSAFGMRTSLKLHRNFYGPFCVLTRIGNMDYKLQLQASMKIHPIFHMCQLQKHLGPLAVPNPNLPLVDANGNIKKSL